MSGYFQIHDRIRFELRGPDATRYLNGQVSIDISRLRPHEARPACLLTAKGKLCAPLFIWRQSPDSFLLEAPAELAGIVQSRLERYLISDNAELHPVEIPSPLYHILTPATSPTPAPQPPPPVNEVNKVNEVPLSIPRLNLPGHDTTTRPTTLPELPPATIDLLRILHGHPLWGRELTEDTLPQEARLETHAVDFDKGCYVGQETVSRLKSVGRVNKRLHGFLGHLEPTTSTRLHLHPPGQPDTPAGHLTSYAPHFDMAQTAALGYLLRQFENHPRLEVTDESGRVIGQLERREFPIQ